MERADVIGGAASEALPLKSASINNTPICLWVEGADYAVIAALERSEVRAEKLERSCRLLAVS